MARGFQPFPTTYTLFDERKLTIWKARSRDEKVVAEAGTVVSAAGDELSVSCGEDSVLEISELQLEGKKRMPVRDFLNGMKLKVGDRLS
jgi:methionyl-tRNA formyltransferase